jgi:hypothetical protein
VQFSSIVAQNMDSDTIQQALVGMRSMFPSLQTVLGLVVDGYPVEKTVSVTFGNVANARGFEVSSGGQVDAEDWRQSSNTNPPSFMLFPTQAFADHGMIQLLHGIDSAYPSNVKMGGVLSSAVEAAAYMVQWSAVSGVRPSSIPTVRVIRNGLVGLTVDSDLAELEQRWPWWQRSLIPMLRWVEFMGH